MLHTAWRSQMQVCICPCLCLVHSSAGFKISMIVTFACHHSSSITLWYSLQNLISYDCRQVPVKLPRQVCSRVIQVPKPAPVVHHAVHQPVLTAPHHGLHHGNPSLLKSGPTQSPKNPVHIRYSLESLTKKYVFLCYQLSQHINQNSFCNLPHTSRLTGSGRRARNFEMCLNISYHAPVQPGAAHHGVHQQPLQHAAIAAGPAHSFINLAG